MTTAPSPRRFRVVLVEPEDPRNVGFVARAMKAAGLVDLRVVHRDGRPLPEECEITGAAARDVLAGARVEPDLDAALAGAGAALAFTRRRFEAVAGDCVLEDAPARLPPGEVALVFGRESRGLERDEVVRCSLACAIPADGSLSYNLGQAVAIALYELVHRRGLAQPSTGVAPAPLDDVLGLADLLADRAGGPHARGSRRHRMLLAVLLRARPVPAEVRLLRGLLRRLGRAPG